MLHRVAMLLSREQVYVAGSSKVDLVQGLDKLE